MNITTTNLNNLENALQNINIQNIFYITWNHSTNLLSCSYNEILSQIQAGNLPIIKATYENEDYIFTEYFLINNLYIYESSYYYVNISNITDYYCSASSSTEQLRMIKEVG